jgi:hypothetical protein
VTALQDWLRIRPFDPRRNVKAVICALRGLRTDDTDDTDDAAEAVVDLPLIRRGIERC